MDVLHREMHRNLNEIITKIRLARQKAASIKISIRNKPVIEFRNLSNNLITESNKNQLYINNIQQLTTLSSLTSISSILPSSPLTTSASLTTMNPLSVSSTPSTLPNLNSFTSASTSKNLVENQILQQQQPTIINCKRSYESELEPSSVNSISLTFSINDSSLFSKTSNDVILI